MRNREEEGAGWNHPAPPKSPPPRVGAPTERAPFVPAFEPVQGELALPTAGAWLCVPPWLSSQMSPQLSLHRSVSWHPLQCARTTLWQNAHPCSRLFPPSLPPRGRSVPPSSLLNLLLTQQPSPLAAAAAAVALPLPLRASPALCQEEVSPVLLLCLHFSSSPGRVSRDGPPRPCARCWWL